MSVHVVLIDNQDSFVYNLVDAFAEAGMECTVYRNTVDPDVVIASKPDVLVLSPGPSHPRDAGRMMELIDRCIGTIPILGICLGFQALLEHFGGTVAPCGPVHGVTDMMELTEEGVASPLFAGLTVDGLGDQPGHLVPVARYHSLGCKEAPSDMISLATCNAEQGTVTMAAVSTCGTALGLQFHPESVLSPSGPHILRRAIELLAKGQLR